MVRTSSSGIGRNPRSARDAANPPRGRQLTPELRAHFHRLLYTWFHLALREENPAPWEDFDLEKFYDWCDSNEQRYGDGHFAERRKALDNILGWLDGRFNLEAVRDALGNAKRERYETIRQGKVVDYHRYLSEHRKVRRSLRAAAKLAAESYERLFRMGFAELFDYGTAEELTPLPQVRDLLRALESDPIKDLSIQGPLRRAGPGRQKQSWLSQARQELRDLGIPSSMCEGLLMAVGLTPYRKSGAYYRAPRRFR